MVILLVAITFALFIIAGILAGRKLRAPHGLQATSQQSPVSIQLEHTDRFFHPAHSWACVRTEKLIEVGADDFATRFIGPVEKVGLPKRNSVFHQGAPLAALHRGKRTITLIAPVSGIVADVNEQLAASPQRVNDSPYEQGWIVKMIPFDLRVEVRNLMKDIIASRWLEAHRLQLINSFAPRLGTVVQDGGQIVQDIGTLLTDDEWQRLAREFFPLVSIRQTSHNKPEEGKSL